MKEKQRIYISGPISGLDPTERKNTFMRVATRLELMGYEVIDPIAEAEKHPEDVTTQDHMRRDLDLLKTCDIIYMMKRWNHSAGCWTEFHDALAIGLEVWFEQIDKPVKFE